MGMQTAQASSMNGFVEPGFEGVREAFAQVANRPGGAAFAAYMDGRVVADLWLGEAEPGRPWQQDTPTVVMSATKGVAALAAHILIDRGLLELDEAVARYWPEFGAGGKDGVLIRHVLSHTSGVTTFPGYLDFMRPDGTGWARETEILRRIAAATPRWKPGTKSTYHALTYGWMLDELIRRVTGRSMRDFIREEIAVPLGIDFTLGAWAGDAFGAGRAAVITPPRATQQAPERVGFEQAFTSSETPLGQSLLADGTSNFVLELERFVNAGPGIAVPLSSCNGISTARDLARIYQLVAQGGALDGVRLMSESAVRDAGSVQFEGADEIWQTPARWGLGFQLFGSMGTRYGVDDSGFGHAGQGGQYGWADPSRGLSFAYVRSYLGQEPDLAPMDALYDAIR